MGIGEDPLLQVLEKYYWVNSAVQQILFYSAVYSSTTTDIYSYLEKRIPELGAVLPTLPPEFFADPATGELNKANKVLNKVSDLIQQDFGHPPTYFATMSDGAFHDNPQVRTDFMKTIYSLWFENLHQNAEMSFSDLTLRILGTSLENVKIVLLCDAKEQWNVIALFTTDPGNFFTLATAFACLHLQQAIAGPSQSTIERRCLVVAPSFDMQAIRNAPRLGKGISLLNATGIWQMQHQLSDPDKAQAVAHRLPDFLGDRYGLLNVKACLANLGF